MARCLPFFRSQDRQPYFVSPITGTASPLYSESFFGWFSATAQKQLAIYPSYSQIGRVQSKLDKQTCLSPKLETVHNVIAKIAPRKYQMDLGLRDQSTVEITGKQWKVSQTHKVRFERMQTADPFPIPEPALAKLPHYLKLMYGISEDDAHKLAHWMALSMLPDQKPPILVITGEERFEAVGQIRSIIDPAFSRHIDLPCSSKDMAQQAVENRILTYSTDDVLSEAKIKVFKEMYSGMRARIKDANPKRDKLYKIVNRPIIIASDVEQNINDHQISIEVNEFRTVDFAEIFGPLLDEMVKIVGQPLSYPKPLAMVMPQIAQQPTTPQWVNTS